MLKINLFFYFLLTLIAITNFSQAEENAPVIQVKKNQIKMKSNPYINMIDYKVCVRRRDKRSIWIEEIKPKGCFVWYSKYNHPGYAARSSLGTNFCFTKSKEIERNLELANFKCVQKSLLNNR